MASSKRERELARMRAERQAARRAAAEARRKARQRTLLATVAGLAVLALIGGVVYATRSDDKATSSLGTQPTASAGATTCTYSSAGKASKATTGKPPATPVNTGPVMVDLTTNQGPISLTLDGAKAPCTVNSFTFLTGQKYFDGTTCHRLTTSGIFVLQCGDPTATGSGGPGYQFADEALTGATYPRGTVAMANAGPGTNGSQFFLVYKDTQLPPSYTPFGKITVGLELLDKVAKGGSNPVGDGKPKTEVKITTAVLKA